jgi:hypothetical protein
MIPDPFLDAFCNLRRMTVDEISRFDPLRSSALGSRCGFGRCQLTPSESAQIHTGSRRNLREHMLCHRHLRSLLNLFKAHNFIPLICTTQKLILSSSIADGSGQP